MKSQKDEYGAILEVRRWQVDFWKDCGVCQHICEPFLGSPNRRRIYRHPQLFLMGLNKARVWKIGGRRMETLSTARMCQRGWSKSRINTIPQALQASGEFEMVAPGAKAVTGADWDSPGRSRHTSSVKSEACTGNGGEPYRHSGSFTEYEAMAMHSWRVAGDGRENLMSHRHINLLKSKDRHENWETPQAP